MTPARTREFFFSAHRFECFAFAARRGGVCEGGGASRGGREIERAAARLGRACLHPTLLPRAMRGQVGRGGLRICEGMFLDEVAQTHTKLSDKAAHD